MTADEVAAWLSLPRKSIYAMVESGEFPADAVIRLGPRRLRFDRRRLIIWVEEKRGQSPGV